jgi:hypothetical protein
MVNIMIILNENFFNIDDGVAVLQKKYSFVFENANIIEQFLNSKGTIKLSEQDVSAITDKAEDFLEDAHKYIDEIKENRDKYYKKSKTQALIGLGLAIVALLMPLSIVGIIIAVLLCVASLIFTFTSVSQSNKADDELVKLKDYQDKLLKLKSKTDNEKIKKKIDSIVERIDAIKK